jgi:hypothetical protein
LPRLSFLSEKIENPVDESKRMARVARNIEINVMIFYKTPVNSR